MEPDPLSPEELATLLPTLWRAATEDYQGDGFTKAAVVEAFAESGRFEEARTLLGTPMWMSWKPLGAAYLIEALARAGRIGEADGLRGELKEFGADALFQGRIVQGLVSAGKLADALTRLHQFSPDDIPFFYEVFPRLHCLDALLRSDDPKAARAMLARIRKGRERHEKCLGTAWMALGLHAWGETEEARTTAARAEKQATLEDLAWVIGTYEAMALKEEAGRCRQKWEKAIGARWMDSSGRDSLRFTMTRAMANLRRYDEAMDQAGSIEKGWAAAKAYGCLAYLMFNAGERERFPTAFEKAYVAGEALEGAERVRSRADRAVLMAWVQRLGLNVSCVTPILRASLTLGRVPE